MTKNQCYYLYAFIENQNNSSGSHRDRDIDLVYVGALHLFCCCCCCYFFATNAINQVFEWNCTCTIRLRLSLCLRPRIFVDKQKQHWKSLVCILKVCSLIGQIEFFFCRWNELQINVLLSIWLRWISFSWICVERRCRCVQARRLIKSGWQRISLYFLRQHHLSS